jgi:hypothetical protein
MASEATNIAPPAHAKTMSERARPAVMMRGLL